MYEILIPIDDENRGIRQVESVLDMPFDVADIHVTLLHVFTENPEGASVSQVGAIHDARDLLEEADIEITLAERSGTPAAEIIAEANDRDADLIVLAGRARSPTGKALFGSTTQQVILDTDRPVVVHSVSQD
ncbi:universal stress protein [Halobacterium sp. KA-4]|uniref:universal stress protein n=1 Tax=Halobacterium sp. KA-4 TaxID=2896367 RepID=UPI001E5070D4|nr:universal stress protein [Halobacterium sp. KA-4]MCD2201717.1 universal stress protein [Halobacterium sp. KA-4]